MTDYVYIEDFTELDRDELLEYLWESTNEIIDKNDIFEIERAKWQVNGNGGYAHIICGRKIELYIYNVIAIDMYMYDFHNGCGSVQEIVNEIRHSKKLNSNNNNNNISSLFTQINI